MKKAVGDSQKIRGSSGILYSSLMSIFVTTCGLFVSLLLRLVVALSEFSARIAGSAQKDVAAQRDNEVPVSIDEKQRQRRERLKESIATRTSEIVDANGKMVQRKGTTQMSYRSERIVQVVKGNVKVAMRSANSEDTDLILTFIKELARFEEMEDSVIASRSILLESLFPKDYSGVSTAEVIILEIDGVPAGFVLYFHNFSTFLGKQGLYIEDLYVREEFRGKGYGRQLLKRVCEIALNKNCGRVEWWCLDWNKRAIEFYLNLGAEAMTDWTVYRLSEESINQIASGTSS